MDLEHMTTFGAQLRRLRLAAGLSQEALAELAGLTANGIGALERGDRRHPYPHTIRALADALGLEGDVRGALLSAARRPSTCAPRRSCAATPQLAFEQTCDATCAPRDYERVALNQVPPARSIEAGVAGAGRGRGARRLRRRHGLRPARILRRCCSCSTDLIADAGTAGD